MRSSESQNQARLRCPCQRRLLTGQCRCDPRTKEVDPLLEGLNFALHRFNAARGRRFQAATDASRNCSVNDAIFKRFLDVRRQALNGKDFGGSVASPAVGFGRVGPLLFLGTAQQFPLLRPMRSPSSAAVKVFCRVVFILSERFRSMCLINGLESLILKATSRQWLQHFHGCSGLSFPEFPFGSPMLLSCPCTRLKRTSSNQMMPSSFLMTTFSAGTRAAAF